MKPLLVKLAQHMEWADATVWNTILTSPAACSDDKLLETLHHVHVVQHLFRQAWAGGSFDLHERKAFADARALAVWARVAHWDIQAVLDGLDPQDLDRDFRVPWAAHFEKHASRPAGSHTLGESAMQVFLHTQHHRGQICTRLRHLDVTPPTIDFIVWLWSGTPPAEWKEL